MATCKECIHYDICINRIRYHADENEFTGKELTDMDKACKRFKDKSNEIKKGLECCTGREKTFSCSGCPFESIPYCGREIMRGSLDLINRLKAENEKLVNIPPKNPMDFCGVICNYAEELIENAKSEAIKEFAERLNDQFGKCTLIRDCFYVGYDINDVSKAIDNLVKEMVGD